MPLSNITITRYRHVQVNKTRDSIRTGGRNDELEWGRMRKEEEEEGGRGRCRGGHYSHFEEEEEEARDNRARTRTRNETEDGRNETAESNENRARSCYRHVPSMYPPSSTRYGIDSDGPTKRTRTFHPPSRPPQPSSREQNDDARRQSSYHHRLERYEKTVYTSTTTTSDQSSDQSRGQSSSCHRRERYENIVYTTGTTSCRAAPPPPPPPLGEPSDQTILCFSRRRTEWTDNTTKTNTNFSPRQAPSAPTPRELTHQTRNFNHHGTERSNYHHHHYSPRQAPPAATSREKKKAQPQSESESFFNPNNSKSSTTTNIPRPSPVQQPSRGGDLYKILKVSPEASHAEIVSVARRRRIEVHPDRLQHHHPGMTPSTVDRIDTEAQNVGLAADTLCDETRRRSYDNSVRRGSRS